MFRFMFRNRLKMHQEDNCVLLLHGLHFSVAPLKHGVSHWGHAAFASTPTFQLNTQRRFPDSGVNPTSGYRCISKNTTVLMIKGKKKGA